MKKSKPKFDLYMGYGDVMIIRLPDNDTLKFTTEELIELGHTKNRMTKGGQ